MFTDRDRNTLNRSRKKLPWPKSKEFKILSLDGGGIRGIFSARVLRECESVFCGSEPIAKYFDLVAGTSTGGILALGLGLQKPAAHMSSLYEDKGQTIFPPPKNPLHSLALKVKQCFRRKYSHDPLEALLQEEFEDSLVGDSITRLCIPAALVPKSEIAVLKTDHHPDYKNDWSIPAWKAARATSAAPTYFEGYEPTGTGKAFIDGGIWANNPIMVAIIEALSAYQLDLRQIKVLSISPGSAPYEMRKSDLKKGFISWRKAINACMHLTAENATSMARLLLGNENITRIEPGETSPRIDLDGWLEAKEKLPHEAASRFSAHKEKLKPFFVRESDPRESFYANPH